MPQYRLPDYNYTNDHQVYLDAWNELVAGIDKLLEPLGFRTYAFDPGVAVGGFNGGRSFTLPCDVAIYILRSVGEYHERKGTLVPEGPPVRSLCRGEAL